jgi:phosphoserine aminotransferase
LASIKQAQKDLLSYPGAGASVMEISHRSKAFAAIHERAKSNVKELLNVSDDYAILFLHGGASLQFSSIAMNFLGEGASADYIVTGSWGSKAVKEAQKVGATNVAWTGKADNFNSVPGQSDLNLDAKAAYLHYTSNETIQGVEFKSEPDTGGVPLICDASSNMLSKPVNISRYGMYYGGAQKNVGPSGVALAVIRKDLLDRVPEGLPSLMDYRLMTEHDSLYNTPPCFPIYMISLTTSWLLDEVGGLAKMEARNKAKAQLLYDAIDNSGGFYRGHAVPESRSLMNVTWRLPSEDLEKTFVTEAAASGLAELKGHRSVGGIRASIYNAMPMEGVEALCAFMAEFQSKAG